MLNLLFRDRQIPPEKRIRNMTIDAVERFRSAFEPVNPERAAKLLRNGDLPIQVEPLLDCISALAEHVNRLEARVAELEGKPG